MVWILLIFFLCISMLCILGFFLSFHLRIIFKNKTTIEHCENKESPYNTGSMYKNWCLVFGDNPLVWFIPSCMTFLIAKLFEKIQA